jgi:hypothetical protein
LNRTVSSEYAIRKADLEADRGHILSLWSLIKSGAPPDERKLDRFYIGNPAGRGVIYLLWHAPSDSPVGILCAGRRDVLLDGTIRKAAVCGDLFVQREHRGLGPRLMLHRHVMEELLTDFELFYGFPNTRAAAMVANERSVITRTLSKLALPLRVTPYMERAVPKPVAGFVGLPGQLLLDLMLKWRLAGTRLGHRVVVADDAFLDRLWQEVASRGVAGGVRDSRFLRWRLDVWGAERFRIFGVAQKDGPPAAYVAFEVDADAHVRVVDALATDDESFRAAIALFALALKKEGARSIALRQITDAQGRLRALKRMGFIETGSRIVLMAGRPGVHERLAATPLLLDAVDNDV